MPGRLRAYLVLSALGIGVAALLPALQGALEGGDAEDRILALAGSGRVRLPAGLSAGGTRWVLQDEETVFVTHLSNQWDHSASVESAAREILSRVRRLPRHRILHLRALTPAAERRRLAGLDADGAERYFDHPPRVPGPLASGMEYPDPYIVDHAEPFPSGWQGPFERGVFSQGGGFYHRQEGAILPLDARYERLMERAIHIPPGPTRFVVLGGWFHACVTSTVKDIALDTVVEDGARRIDVLLPANAVFVNRPDPDGESGSASLARVLDETPPEELPAFFQDRLESIDRYLARKAGVDPGVLFIHRARGYRLAGRTGRPRVHVWVVESEPER